MAILRRRRDICSHVGWLSSGATSSQGSLSLCHMTTTGMQAHPDRKAAAANLTAASRLELCVDVQREWSITLEFLHLVSLRAQAKHLQ